MLADLPAGAREELEQLAARYGQPLVRDVTLEMERPFSPLSKNDRYGEVCMVVRRPDGSLITAKKTFYPEGAFRLLTGGISHGEGIFDALLRETQEETGLEVEVARFLAAVAYRTPHQPERCSFFTFAFLLEERGGTLGAIDEDERVEGFGAVAPADLPAMAERLAALPNTRHPEVEGSWRDWGVFRAVIHRVVYEALADDAG